MIKLSELNPHKYATTPEIDANLNTLLFRLNRVRAEFDKPMTVTSGLRSEGQQKALIAQGKSNAMHSKHLVGAAADVFDPTGELKVWVAQNLGLLEEIGLWMEDFAASPTWVHFQCLPPKSGNRIFKP